MEDKKKTKKNGLQKNTHLQISISHYNIVYNNKRLSLAKISDVEDFNCAFLASGFPPHTFLV